ncbi:MAG TPA: hypothetical protein VJM31_02115 [Vicinamibacterales bacterium]|nr:hypothetical protein [Vicinamibacterales bacterium]
MKGRDEAIVMPFVSVWSSCERCQFVWRSSLLDKVTSYARRRVGLARYEKVDDRYAASSLMDTSALAEPVELGPSDPDSVAQWLVTQETAPTGLKLSPAARSDHQASEPAAIEACFDQLTPSAVSVRRDFKEDFDFSFAGEAPIEPPVAKSRPSADTPLEASVDRALTNVEDLYEAFKRLEQQLGGMEELCEQLAHK